MAQINPYLAFNGDCEVAFKFYKSIFGAEFSQVSRFAEMPPMPGYELPDAAKEKIMHITLPISKETVLMGCDTNPNFGEVRKGQNIRLSVNAESEQEADRIFLGLSEGGKVTMPLAKTFWNAYFGILVDKFDIVWMVNYFIPKTT
jgi:PhnB protein